MSILLCGVAPHIGLEDGSIPGSHERRIRGVALQNSQPQSCPDVVSLSPRGRAIASAIPCSWNVGILNSLACSTGATACAPRRTDPENEDDGKAARKSKLSVC